MAEEKSQAFYVVRKGDTVGIYRDLRDCQAQAASSPLNPSTTVYKGYGLSKEAEEYLATNGLKNASFSIASSGLRDGLFRSLAICPFQDAVGPRTCSANLEKEHVNLGKFSETQAFNAPAPASSSVAKEAVGLSSRLVNPRVEYPKLENYKQPQACNHPASTSCIIEFDGASRGNPGKSGAGAVLRTEDGSMVCRLREGVGIATNNVAEYRALILGLKYAVKGGFKHVLARGDSQLVCKQVEGVWKTKNQNMADLCKEARELKDKFTSFRILHVVREYNTEADAQANIAINLRDGEVSVDVKHCHK